MQWRNIASPITPNPFVPLLGSSVRCHVTKRWYELNDAHGTSVWLKDRENGQIHRLDVSQLRMDVHFGRKSLGLIRLRPQALSEHAEVLTVFLLEQCMGTPEIVEESN